MRSHVLRFILCRMTCFLSLQAVNSWENFLVLWVSDGVGAASLNWAGCVIYLRQPCKLSAAVVATTPLNYSRWLKPFQWCDNSSSKFRTFSPHLSVGNGMKGRTKLWDVWHLGKPGLPLFHLLPAWAQVLPRTHNEEDHQQPSESPPDLTWGEKCCRMRYTDIHPLAKNAWWTKI